MLSDVEIIELLDSRRLVIEPFASESLRPSSYALRLAEKLLVLDHDMPADVGECDDRGAFSPRFAEGERLVLQPGEFALASSVETLQLPIEIAGWLSLASRVARLGVVANGGAMLIHAGFGADAPARLTFELFNASPRVISLRTGMPFCHLTLQWHERPPRGPYRARPCEHGSGPAPAEY